MNPNENKEEPTRGLLWLPGYIFFTESIPTPIDAKESELRSIAELALEASSPFPLEHLYWGFLHDNQRSRIFVYAAYREAIHKESLAFMPTALSALPSFLEGYGLPSPKPCVHFLKSIDTLSALVFEANNTTPIAVESLLLTETNLQAARKQLLGTLNLSGFLITKGHWECLPPTMQPNGSIQLNRQYYEEEGSDPIQKHTTTLSHTNNFLWNADVRDSLQIAEKRRALRLRQFIGKTLITASLTLAAFLGLELVKLAGSLFLKHRNNTLIAQAPLINHIESKNNLAFKLESISDQYTSPFSQLALINDLRPEKVYFTSMSLEAQSMMAFEGAASDANEVNGFVEKLSQGKGIAKAELTKILSREGKVFFTLNVQFKEEEPAL